MKALIMVLALGLCASNAAFADDGCGKNEDSPSGTAAGSTDQCCQCNGSQFSLPRTTSGDHNTADQLCTPDGPTPPQDASKTSA